MQYYQIQPDPRVKSVSKVYESDYDKRVAAENRGEVYLGPFIADDLGRDEITEHDWIPSVGCKLVTDRFVSAVRCYDMRQPEFFEVTITWGPENLLEWVGDVIAAYYTVKLPQVEVIDAEKTPLHFWPTLKKFKMLDYVITRPMPDDVHIGIDQRQPGVVLCTEDFKSWAERDRLMVGFTPVPCAI
ncbi:hypothetical protein [Tateyamaria omphalii]|nr:hypothetical protein [Tateyamaria omphalii]